MLLCCLHTVYGDFCCNGVFGGGSQRMGLDLVVRILFM